MNLLKYFWNKDNRKYAGAFAAGVLGVYTEPLYLLLFLMIRLFKGRIIKSKAPLFFVVILLHGLCMSFFTGYTVDKFIQQFILIFIVLFGYIQLYRSSSEKIEYWFGMYMAIAYVVAILGLIQLFVKLVADINIFPYTLDLRQTQNSERVHSILLEAGHFALFITPAVSYIVISKLFFRNNVIKCLIILSSAVLTFSSSMYLAIAIAIIFRLYDKLSRFKIVYYLIGILSVVYMFTFDYSDSEYQEGAGIKNAYQKIMQSAEAVSSLMSPDTSPEFFENFNLSTYTTMANAWVAINAPYRFGGTGLGTHQQNYESEYVSDYIYYGFNKEDGYSLFTRILSEFGFLGIALYLYCVIRFYNRKNILSCCLLIFIISALIKGGLYSLNCSVLFQYLYYKCSKLDVEESHIINCLNPKY